MCIIFFSDAWGGLFSFGWGLGVVVIVLFLSSTLVLSYPDIGSDSADATDDGGFSAFDFIACGSGDGGESVPELFEFVVEFGTVACDACFALVEGHFSPCGRVIAGGGASGVEVGPLSGDDIVVDADVAGWDVGGEFASFSVVDGASCGVDELFGREDEFGEASVFLAVDDGEPVELDGEDDNTNEHEGEEQEQSPVVHAWNDIPDRFHGLRIAKSL